MNVLPSTRSPSSSDELATAHGAKMRGQRDEGLRLEILKLESNEDIVHTLASRCHLGVIGSIDGVLSWWPGVGLPRSNGPHSCRCGCTTLISIIARARIMLSGPCHYSYLLLSAILVLTGLAILLPSHEPTEPCCTVLFPIPFRQATQVQWVQSCVRSLDFDRTASFSSAMATASLSSSNAPEHVQKHIRLLSASVSGNENRVLELLAEESWTSNADHHALRQALVKVATKGNLKVLRLLLKHGAGVQPKRENELSPLFKAAEAGHLAVATELLEHGADPDWRGKNGQTVLFAACMRGHDGVVKALLDKGADVNGGKNQDGKPGDKDGRTPLLFLASEKHGKWTMETIKLLLQQKDVDLDPRDSISRTPLHWTATNNYIDLARALLSGEFGKQADINAAQNRGKTALHLAAEHNQVDFVELLLAYRANPDAVSDGRWTPLHNACDKGHDVVVAKLLAAGANVNAELSNRMTPLHWAAFNGHGTVVKLLLERPETNISIKDQFERTALLCAAERHHKDLVHLLSPSRAPHRLSESAREASKLFSATVVDFGDFQEMKYRKGDVQEKKKQLVFKPSIYDLLYGWEDSERNVPTVPILAKNVKWEPHFRWIHLPANNIAWVETLLAKSFVEGGFRDVEGFKALEKCFDQEHKGAQAHAKFMRTFCQRVPSRRAEKDDNPLGSVSEQAAETGPAVAESIITDTSENSTLKSEIKKKSKSEQISERHPGKQQKRKKGNPGNPPGTKEAKLSSRQSSFAPSFASTEAFRQLVNNGKMVLFVWRAQP